MKMKLEEIHDCEKCHNKMVCISVDMFGNTYCGYCSQPVDYKSFFGIRDLKRDTKWRFNKKAGEWEEV